MPVNRFRGTVRPQLALAIIFILRGILFGSWIARVPAIAELLGVSRTELGSVLIAGAIGALVAFQVTGPRISRWGSAYSVRWFGIAWAVCYLLALFSPNPAAFFLAFLVYGFMNGTCDVSMNAQAVEIERQLGRPILSTMHGMFSVGALAGAAIGAGLAALDVPIQAQFVVLVSLIVIAWYLLSQFLVPDERIETTMASSRRRPFFSIGPRILWPLGAIALCAGLMEEALADWGALFLSEDLGANPGIAALGYTIFSAAALVGRLAGDSMVRRFGPVLVIRVGAAIAIAGVLFGALMAVPWAFLLSFACAGLGFSATIPITYRAAGSVPGIERSVGVAAVATACYSAFLIGPPVIGAIGDHLSLQVAFIGVALLVSIVIVLAPSVERVTTGTATGDEQPETNGAVAPASTAL